MALTSECLELADDTHRTLARGWNTWDTRSALRHVLLPQGLAISLGFAAYDKMVWLENAFFGVQQLPRTAGTQLTSLKSTLPISNQLEVRPGPRTYTGAYTCLYLDLRGARFRVETCAQQDDWLALITPLQDDPWPRVLTAHVGFLWNRPGHAHRLGDHHIVAHLPERNIDIHTGGQPFLDPNLPPISPYLSIRLDRPVVVSAGEPVGLEEAQRRIRSAQETAGSGHLAFGELSEAHEAMQACLAWNVIYEPKYRRVICPVTREWNCKRGGYVLFGWDSFFTAWMIAADHPDLGYACAIETFREMVDDAFVPNVVQATGRVSRDRSQPPVAGLCLLGMHRLHPNPEAIKAMWPALMAWNRWWESDRKNQNGTISLGSNPFEPRVGDPAEFIQPSTGDGAAIESGLDNSPMYDDPPFDSASHLMLIEDVGMTSLYIADCLALAQLARAIGRDRDAEELASRADVMIDALSHLWSSQRGMYLNRYITDGQWSATHSPTSFYPLLTGSPTPEQVDRMIREHLMNPEEYQGQWMLPMSPRHEPGFQEQLYQRGRIWPPINFLVYLGLRNGRCAEARQTLVKKSLALLLQGWREHGVVAETYSAIDGSGGRGEHTNPLYSWGPLLGFMAMIESDMVPALF